VRALRAAVALSVGVGVVATAAPVAAAPRERAVRAVVVVRPGVALPLAVPGGRVSVVLRHVGAEVVSAPMSALRALAADPRVAGMTPDRHGRVTGDDSDEGDSDGVLAAQALGGQAGKPDTGAGVNVALLDTGVSDTPALNRASGRITDGVDVSQLAAGGPALTSGHFTDGYGHGTFLASLIAGGRVPGSGKRAIGVAPAARVVVVKVADSHGITSLSEVLAGLDWVASHAKRSTSSTSLSPSTDRLPRRTARTPSPPRSSTSARRASSSLLRPETKPARSAIRASTRRR